MIILIWMVFCTAAAGAFSTQLKVEGQIPKESDGALMRIGESHYSEKSKFITGFTGDGMIHALRLKEGEAHW